MSTDPNETPLLTREQWMLTQPWRIGTACGSVVCDPPPGQPDMDGTVRCYGGLPVLESCPLAVGKQIVRLHNLAVGCAPDAPGRRAEIDDEVA